MMLEYWYGDCLVILISMFRSLFCWMNQASCCIHLGARTASIHDHSNYDDLLGFGEVVVVLNGVEFRTRHNDYHLIKPSTKTRKYHRTEKFAFPEVPQAVSSQCTHFVNDLWSIMTRLMRNVVIGVSATCIIARKPFYVTCTASRLCICYLNNVLLF